MENGVKHEYGADDLPPDVVAKIKADVWRYWQARLNKARADIKREALRAAKKQSPVRPCHKPRPLDVSRLRSWH